MGCFRLKAIALVAGDQVEVEMRDALAGGFSAVHFDMVGIELVAFVDDSAGFAQDKGQKAMFLGAQLPIIAIRLNLTFLRLAFVRDLRAQNCQPSIKIDLKTCT
jgi:hypothetical protein